MMNANAFRSHLMQQFVATARNQSRPPLALASSSLTVTSRQHAATTRQDILQHLGAVVNNNNNNNNNNNDNNAALTQDPLLAKQQHSVSALDDVDEVDDEQVEDSTSSSLEPSALAASMQDILNSRRTISRFLPVENHEFLLAALNRALACARNAPNHKRTEPLVFKRILSSTSTTALETLAEIVFQVTLARKKDLQEANKKRQRWFEEIPAYVVALVENQPPQEPTEHDDDDVYQELSFVPPQTERQLEDYAAACAGIQNMLLSLNAEGLGTKWATGPVIKTRAFRKLVNAKTTDRVAGLILVGSPNRIPKQPRRHKSWQEFVEEL